MPLAHVAVPDLDNVAKFALDGMNELVYQDDKQVAKLVACKLFDSEGGCNGRTGLSRSFLASDTFSSQRLIPR